MARILAIDYGTKRTGIAVTDPLQIVASALDTITTEKLMDFLTQYVAKEPVELFVVGEVYHADGSPMHSTPHIEGFVKRLKKNFPQIPIERVDESFTSKMAFQTMIDSGISKKKRRDKSLVDKISAVLILQAYLEKRSFLK